jgi:hypothetical protein
VLCYAVLCSQERHESVLLSFGDGATDEIEKTIQIRNMYVANGGQGLPMHLVRA